MDKTVGIITVHRYFNYGSALQAYATQVIFEKLGYDAFIIDYDAPNAFIPIKNFISHKSLDDSYYISKSHLKPQGIIGKTKKLIRGILNCSKLSKLLYKKFDIRKGINLYEFWHKNFNLTKRYHNLSELYQDPPKLDVFVVGGDQLWNTNITYNNPAFFLTFVKSNAKKITFSTSIGIPAIPEKALDDFKSGLENLSTILLREQEAVDYLETLGYKSKRVLDPTMMLSKNEWLKVTNDRYHPKYKKYILVYLLNPNDWTDELLEGVRKKSGLPIIYIGEYKQNLKDISSTGPVEVASYLTLFSKANIVVTDSFHGTVFTLLFEKSLVTTLRNSDDENSMNSRQRNIIDLFGLQRTLYQKKYFDSSKLDFSMDYSKINHVLDRERELTWNLLKDALKLNVES